MRPAIEYISGRTSAPFGKTRRSESLLQRFDHGRDANHSLLTERAA